MKFKNVNVNIAFWLCLTHFLCFSLFGQNPKERFYYVQFEHDSASLSSDDSLMLGDFLFAINAQPYRVFVIGHTDSDGDNPYNFKLSEDRALAVKTYINFLKPEWQSDLRVSFEGELSPISSNSTDEGKSINRRVEIRIFYPNPKQKEIQPIKKKPSEAPFTKPVAKAKPDKPNPHSHQINSPSHTLEVIDSETGDSLSATLNIFSLDGNPIDSEIKIVNSKTLQIEDHIQECQICIQSKGYVYQCQRYIQTQRVSKTYLFELQPLQKGIEITLKDLVFFTDSDILKPESFPELNALVRTLRDNPSLKIQIKGHANWPLSYGATPEYIFNLSRQRARAVTAFLIEYEIDIKRLDFIGVGNREPIYEEPETWEQVDLNKRVNFIILEF